MVRHINYDFLFIFYMMKPMKPSCLLWLAHMVTQTIDTHLIHAPTKSLIYFVLGLLHCMQIDTPYTVGIKP